jgi:hypothetical protein
MKTCSHRPNVSAMLVRYATIRGIPFPFKDLLPWEEAPLSRSCSRGRRSRLGLAPMGGGPIQWSAPMGRGHVQVLLPWEEVTFFQAPESAPKDHRYFCQHFFHLQYSAVYGSQFMSNDNKTNFSWFYCYFIQIQYIYCTMFIKF